MPNLTSPEPTPPTQEPFTREQSEQIIPPKPYTYSELLRDINEIKP